MRMLWCWRCKADMPILDEEEFGSVSRLYRDCVLATKEFRETHRLPLQHIDMNERFKPVRLHYEVLTGLKDCHENAILHHRLSLYGSPCHKCGKPLRTPRAKLCGACMTRVQRANHDIQDED